MPNYNKNKGKTLEREVAKELTEVFGLNFERVWSSGAFTGGQNSVRLQKLTREQALLSTGDILMPIELEHVQIECKFYKAFSFQSLFDNNETLNGWIDQARGSSGKLWFLIFKINNCGKFVVFDKKDETLFTPEANRCVYKNAYVVTAYDNFFSKNKEAILQYGKVCQQQNNTTTTQSSMLSG
jgi:Holliday junction resolvase